MQAYLVHRLLALIPTLLFASLIVFVTVRLIPGNVIDLMLSQYDISADKFSSEQLISALGLGKPIWEQSARRMGGILLARVPVTIELGLLALAPGLCLSVVVYATNMFGDALCDLFDPRHARFALILAGGDPAGQD
jgi:peptide/nickel transport system permease protein